MKHAVFVMVEIVQIFLLKLIAFIICAVEFPNKLILAEEHILKLHFQIVDTVQILKLAFCACREMFTNL